mmetsp:Transcript_103215/g.266827  ORF Transcript_103215/g.266827 Transcript_103215/m.266827 type:complete len:168 (+) Transcript_103215:57-560(+)
MAVQWRAPSRLPVAFLLLGAATFLMGRLPAFVALPPAQGHLAGASLRPGSRSLSMSRRGVEEDFESGVSGAKAVLFVQEGDQKSDMARETLMSMGVKYNEMELLNQMGQSSIQPSMEYLEYMETKTGTEELPQIHFRGGKAIGGIDNIFDALDSGELLQMFKDAGMA